MYVLMELIDGSMLLPSAASGSNENILRDFSLSIY